MIKFSNELFCFACGQGIKIDETEIKFCSHVDFVYGFVSGDDDGFVYIRPAIAEQYVNLMKESDALTQYLKENEIEIDKTISNRFI